MHATWKSAQILKLGESLTPVTLKIREGQLCPVPKSTIMENFNEIHAILEVKKCKLGQHLTTAVTSKIGPCQPSPFLHSGWTQATIM